MKKALVLLITCMLTLAATGCSFTLSPQELYRLPKLPTEYTELDSRISAILADGTEYAAPTSGSNIQPVQLVDLNSDGQEEAVAFFRNASAEKPLKICIFTPADESYEQTATIESSGTSINSIVYNDLDGDGHTELLVGWRTTTDLQALVVYALRGSEPVELMRTSYVRYTLTDLDQDGLQELVVFRATEEEGGNVADYYVWQDGQMQMRPPARVSMTMAELSQQGRITSGTLQDGSPALFVTGVEESTLAITDILAARNGELANIALSDATGVSREIAPFRSLYPTDINNDGVTEVPVPVALPSWDDEDSSYQRIDWRCYDSVGEGSTVMSTYHSIEDGWYLHLPEEWRGKILVTRSFIPDEAYVTFYVWGQEGVQPFLRITAITGSSRSIKAMRGGRFTLSRQAETTYTAELLEANETWEHSITEDEVRAAFSLIAKEWTYGDN